MLPVCCYRENKKYVPFLFLFVLISFFSFYLDEILLIIIKNKEEEHIHTLNLLLHLRKHTTANKPKKKGKRKASFFFSFFFMLCFSLRKPHFHSCKLPLFLFPINKYSSHVNLTHFAFPITSLNNCVRDAFIHLSKVTHF